MKGDFSRRTFDAAKQYSAVLQEQGRMLTDADLEEEHRILAHRIEHEAADLIGGCGGPVGRAGFEITSAGGIGSGVYYVDGLRVENLKADVTFAGQPFRDVVAWPPEQPGWYRVYLDVWRRLVTALDDPAVREVALGGPTTAAREQTVWQVRAIRAAENGAPTCLDDLVIPGETSGEMAARDVPETPTANPCDVPPRAGFMGLENQLYRVEVHADGEAYQMPAVEDGVEVTGFSTTSSRVLTVADATTFAKGAAVELFAEASPNRASLFHVVEVTGDAVTLDWGISGFSVGDRPRLRRVDATFVWSRDNGSVVTAVTGIGGDDNDEVTVKDLGPDAVLGFAPGQWVELADERHELENRPGQLVRIQGIDIASNVVTLATPASADIDITRSPKLRRWDGAGAIRSGNVNVEDDWIALESGIQVRFTVGHYRTGDWWHFPARTATIDPVSGHIKWPMEGTEPDTIPPHGVTHHTCPLALVNVTLDADETPTVGDPIDCRKLFPPVTELTNLLYVGGDGQEGMPDPANETRPVKLGAPLRVRVANGAHPVEGATVEFGIEDGNAGYLRADDPGAGGFQPADRRDSLVVTADGNGIATCWWAPSGKSDVQQCVAKLRNAAGAKIPHQVVSFHASLSTAARVAYDPSVVTCPDLADATTVQEAIDRLCQRDSGGGCCCVTVGQEGEFKDILQAIETLVERGQFDICLCLLPGDHRLDKLSVDGDAKAAWNLAMSGCGPGTRLDVLDGVEVARLNSFVLRRLDITVNGGGGMLARQCREVTIEGCRISGLVPETALVRIVQASRVHVEDSTFEAFLTPALDEATSFLDGIDRLPEPYKTHQWRQFGNIARELANELAGRDIGERQDMGNELMSRIEAGLRVLSYGEAAAYRRLAETLFLEAVDPLAILDHLIAIRHAVLRTRPGVALAIGEFARDSEEHFGFVGTRDGAVTIVNNDVVGAVSLYGLPSGGQPFGLAMLRKLKNRLGEEVVHLGGVDTSVLITGNRLSSIIVGRDMESAVRDWSGTEGFVPEVLHASLQCTDNVIGGVISQMVARHLSLANNEFTLSAVRDVGEEVRQQRVADIVGDSAVYTGNHGQRAGHGGTFRAQITNITRVSAEVANLELDFIL